MMRRQIKRKVIALVFAFLGVGAAAGSPAATPDDAGTWLENGRSHIRSKRYDAAVLALTTAAKISPLDPVVQKELGNAYYYKGDLTQARSAYKESLRLNPGDAALASFLLKLEALAEPGSNKNLVKAPSPKVERGNWLVPALMSAVIPGAGQVYDGRLRGAAALGLPTMLLIGVSALAYSGEISFRDWLAKQEAKGQKPDEGSNEMKRYMALQTQVLAGLAISMYVWTIIDAAVVVPPRALAGMPAARLSVAFMPEGFQARFKLAEF